MELVEATMDSGEFATQYPAIGRPTYIAPTGRKWDDLQLAIRFERVLELSEIADIEAYLHSLSPSFSEVKTYAPDPKVVVARYKGATMEHTLLTLLQERFNPLKPYSANVALHIRPNPLIAFISFAGKKPDDAARNNLLAQLREQDIVDVVYYNARTNAITVLFKQRTAKFMFAPVARALTTQNVAGLRFRIDKIENMATLAHYITTGL